LDSKWNDEFNYHENKETAKLQDKRLVITSYLVHFTPQEYKVTYSITF